MPATLTYPGVYIEELSSGVHTITGVATSIAAFVGWAPEGPTDAATLVQSWPDYQNQFGGLTRQSDGTPNYLGYAVNQFFQNGGSQAYIVRLVVNAQVKAANPNDVLAVAATVAIPGNGGTAFTVTAIDEGQWANTNYGIRIIANPASTTRFSLLVVYAPTPGQESTLESFPNLSLDPNDALSRSVASVINDPDTGSSFIQVGSVTTNFPTLNPLTSPAGTAAYALGSTVAGVDGTVLVPNNPEFISALNTSETLKDAQGRLIGVYLLARVNIFNLLCVPGLSDLSTINLLQEFCFNQRAFYIVDPPEPTTATVLSSYIANGPDSSITGTYAINSALYFPWISAPDPLNQNRATWFPPCGFMAGLYAATDADRGVWKAPAGIDASLTGALALTTVLTDLENGSLNTQAVNCLRNFRVYGNVIWGARTLQGNDQAGSQWKYVPIRRLALYLESSLYDGTQWVVFEPNDEPLWSQIRLNVGAFMQGLFLQGAFQGSTPAQAYFVKCDAENNPQSQIDQGIVTILVGFAPLYPAEFVVIQIQQMAGQLQS